MPAKSQLRDHASTLAERCNVAVGSMVLLARYCLHPNVTWPQGGPPTCRARSASGGAPAMAAAGSSASGARALSEAAFASASSPVKLRSGSSTVRNAG